MVANIAANLLAMLSNQCATERIWSVVTQCSDKQFMLEAALGITVLLPLADTKAHSSSPRKTLDWTDAQRFHTHENHQNNSMQEYNIQWRKYRRIDYFLNDSKTVGNI
jgi:hypothetical protein